MANENLSQEDIDALLSGGVPQGGDSSDDSSVPEPAGEPAIPNLPVSESSLSDPVSAQPLAFSQLTSQGTDVAPQSLDLILDVTIELTVELGRKSMLIKDILSLGPGSIVELNKLAGEPVDLLVNNKLLARGEVVVINENFGIRIIDIVGPAQRIKNLK